MINDLYNKKEPRFNGIKSEKSTKIMKCIKGKDTKIETTLRKALWKNGIRYRKNYKKLPGKPDIVITSKKIVIFCDSEFFHGKDWEDTKLKIINGRNSDYWINKIEKNILRDKITDKKLEENGWKVIHFWGKDIMNNLESCVDYVLINIHSI